MTSNTKHPGMTLPPTAPRASGSATQTEPGKRFAAHLLLFVICAMALLPFLWMISTSLKTREATTASPPKIWPYPAQWHNYIDVFHHEGADFLLWTRNTLVIAVLGVLGTTKSRMPSGWLAFTWP